MLTNGITSVCHCFIHIGAALAASFGDCSVRSQDDSQDSKGFYFQASGVKSAFLADLFASLSLTAQHGNFQRLFIDLTRFHARLDFPSGSRFLAGATRVAQDLINSRQPSLEDVQAICPHATLSLQQQVPAFLLKSVMFIFLQSTFLT